MSSSTSSQKPGGAGPSRSFVDAGSSFALAQRFAIARSRVMTFWLLGLFLSCGLAIAQTASDLSPFAASKTAAERCSSKIKKLEDFSDKRKPDERLATRFSEEEIDSYLALDLSPKYHPSLKSLRVFFEENRLRAIATIDFDRLGETSTRFLSKLISLMLSGTHTISARGRLVSGNGSAYFDLEEAHFDGRTLPKSLVEEIITVVGQKQNPPFDPLRPSTLPYKIEKIDVHSGYIIVYQ
jgi:hypothetical protein